jgi:hypothetical protein
MSKRNKMILVGAGVLVAAYYLMKQKQTAPNAGAGDTTAPPQGQRRR